MISKWLFSISYLDCKFTRILYARQLYSVFPNLAPFPLHPLRHLPPKPLILITAVPTFRISRHGIIPRPPAPASHHIPLLLYDPQHRFSIPNRQSSIPAAAVEFGNRRTDEVPILGDEVICVLIGRRADDGVGLEEKDVLRWRQGSPYKRIGEEGGDAAVAVEIDIRGYRA